MDERWLSDQFVSLLRWQLANPGANIDLAPELPWAGRRVWTIFLDLHETRGSNGFGPSPISYAEIEGYSRMKREPIRPFEVEIIRRLDVEFISHDVPGRAPVIQSRSMSPQLFDALFG